MRKFTVVALAALLCLAMAVPAMAAVTVGGAISSGVGWGKYNSDYTQNMPYTGNTLAGSRKTWTQDVSIGTRLFAAWTAAKDTLGGEIAFNLVDEQSSISSLAVGTPPAGGKEGLRTRFAYGWWKINDMLKFTAGQQWTMYSWLTADQNCGVGCTSSSENAGYGNLGNDREAGLRLDIKLPIEKMMISIGAYAAEKNGAVTYYPTATPTTATTLYNSYEESQQWGRWELMFTGKFGPVWVYPAFFMYDIKYTHDGATAGWVATADTTIKTSGFSLPVEARIGKFAVKGEYNMGKNVGDSSLWTSWGGTAGSPGIAKVPAAEWDGDGKVHDCDYTGWWLQFDYSFGKLAPRFIYGTETTEMDRPGTNLDWKYKRNMWMVQLNMELAPRYFFGPYYGVFDEGKAETRSNSVSFRDFGRANATVNGKDLGKVSVFGGSFWIMF